MKTCVIGDGGHANVVKSLLEQCGEEVIGPLSREQEDATDFSDAAVVIAIGDNERRRIVAAKHTQHRAITAIHPSAIIDPSATIGDGSQIMAGAIIQFGAEIGRHCIVNTGAKVDHNCVIGDFAHISPGCTLCGDVVVGESTWVGAGSTVIQGITIGKNALVGAGSVVVNDIPDNVVAYGNPCKVIRNK